VVINPIYKDATRDKVMGFVGELAASLRAKTWRDEKIRVHIDDRDIRGGEKGWDQIKRGVPIRLDIGPKDIEKNSVFVGRRDKQPKDKSGMERAVFENQCADILSEIQDTYLREAKKKRDSRIVKVSSKEELVQYFTDTEDPGWVQTYWDLESSLDAEFKKHKISPRCLPLDHKEASGTCIASGGTGRAVLIGRSY
jgi:prolyl-tRNA synthetase